MTVKELIEQLEQFSSDEPVKIGAVQPSGATFVHDLSVVADWKHGVLLEYNDYEV